MDWRYNSIWWTEIDEKINFHCDYKTKIRSSTNFEDAEYAATCYLRHNELSLDPLPKSDKLLFLELNWSNIKSLNGIERFKNLKRLELHYCSKLENDYNISSLKETLEFFRVDDSKKYVPSEELFQLKKLKVLCLNSCGDINNLIFLKYFPKLIDFRFVDTNILNGDLIHILKHPTIRTVGFMNKKHYNYSSEEINKKLNLRSNIKFQTWIKKEGYETFRYDYE